MRKLKILAGLFFVIAVLSNQIIAQKDSVLIESTTESITESNYTKKKEYKYIDVNLIEEKTLVKFGLSPFFNNFSFNFNDFALGHVRGSFVVERKIVPSLSVLVNNNFGYETISQYDNGWVYSGDIGIRYYYLMNKRINKSKGANNFHSNYFSFELVHPVSYYNYQSETNNVPSYPLNLKATYWEFRPAFKLSWGIQRRVGKWGYIDAGPFIAYQKYKEAGQRISTYNFGLNLSLGFAIGL